MSDVFLELAVRMVVTTPTILVGTTASPLEYRIQPIDLVGLRRGEKQDSFACVCSTYGRDIAKV